MCMSLNARKGKKREDDEFYNILQKVQWMDINI